MKWQDLRPPLLTVAAALLTLAIAGAGFLAAVGANPVEAASALFESAFGNTANFGEVVVRMIPVATVALALIPSLRIGLFNIGAPGQMAAGALLASLPALYQPSLPVPAQLAAGFALACVGGGLLGFVCGRLRAALKVNEILSTLVFNVLAELFLEYLLAGPMHGANANIPESNALPTSSWIGLISNGGRAHWGILIVFALLALAWIVDRTPLGYRLKLFGASEGLARQAGVDAGSMIVGSMVFAGACAGLAGWEQVAGVDHRLYPAVAAPVGYTGLFAALFGGSQPLGVLAASFAFAILLHGGDYLQIGAGISPELISALIGMILLVIVGRSAVRPRGAN